MPRGIVTLLCCEQAVLPDELATGLEVARVTTADEETVGLRVLDDGPGIPERERRVITGETDITQTNHSRGLGLWLAWYVAEAIDGSLSFDETHDGGAVVLELPRCQE